MHDDERPPGSCPVCGAPASKFEEFFDDDEQKAPQRPTKPGDDDEFYGEFDEP